MSFLPIVFAKRIRIAMLFITSFILMGMFFVMTSGADWMPDFRFMVPVLPIFSLCLAVSFIIFANRLKSKITLKNSIVIAVILLLSILFFRVFQVQRSGKHWKRITRTLHSAHGGISDYLLQHAKGDDTIALMDIGLISYATDMRIIDLCGLTDEKLAHTPGIWGVSKFDTDYIQAQKPDYIVLSAIDKRGLTPDNAFILPEKKLLERILTDNNYEKVLEKEFAQYSLILLRRK